MRRAALAALLVEQFRAGAALRSPVASSGEQPLARPGGSRTYLWHKECNTLDGLGGHVIKVRPYIARAVRNNWTFVCNPKDWNTGLHHTDNMGFLFGCNSESSVVGDIAAYDSVKNLRFASLGSVHDDTLAERNVVYETKECKSMPPWGESWTWFRSQFHLVRRQDPERVEPQCWPSPTQLDLKGGAAPRKNIVLAIRKGDDPSRSKHADVYMHLLGALFQGDLANVPRIPAKEAHVVVISEALENETDISELRRGFESSDIASSFLIGAPETEAAKARRRLVRDLDCMAQSDVLVASVSGLSDLAAAVQRPPGVTLVLEKSSTRHDGIPNSVHVNVQRGAESVVESWPSEELPNVRHVRVVLPRG